MDDTIKTFIGSILAPASLLAIFAFFLVLWRTRSLHALVMRCWGLMSGSADLVDGDVKSYGKELHNLSYFQVLTGLRIRSLDEATRLIAWAREHRLDLRNAAWCGRYFDAKALRVKTETLPGRAGRIGLVAFVAVELLISLSVFLFFASASKVYFQFKQSGTHFYLSHEGARKWFPTEFSSGAGTAPLDADVCRQNISDEYLEASGFTRKESFDICSILAADDAKSRIDSLLRQQKGQSFGLLVIFAILILPSGLWLVRIGYARELDERLSRLSPEAVPRPVGQRRERRLARIAERRRLLLRK